MPSTVKRQSAAVMFTDIAGYTSIMASDEEKALSLLQDKRKILKPLIKKNDGVYVKGTGDGTLSYFDSAYKASKCAKLFQESIYDNKNMNVRVGIHVGDIVLDDGDVYGDGVNVASRLESMSPVGGICVSNTVYDELRNKKEFDGVELGLQSLKGVGRLIEIYGLKGDLLTEPKPSDYQDNKVAVHTDDEVPSIAIIPFDNKGADEDVFYAYGISADLISDCSGAGLIRVAGLKEVEELGDIPFKEKAKKLFVRYVATGTLWKMGDMFQLSVELYDTKGKKIVWSDRWEEDWNNLPSIKGSLSDGLLKALDTTSEVEKNVETRNTEAYEFYLRAKHKYDKRENTDDTEIARGLINKAIELDDNLLDAKDWLAWIFLESGDYSKAGEIFIANLKQAEKLGDKSMVGSSLNGIGMVYFTNGRFKKAVEYTNRSLKIFKDINDKKRQSIALFFLTRIHSLIGTLDKAFDYCMINLEISKEIEDERGVGTAILMLSQLYWRKGDLNKAIEFGMNSLEIFKNLEFLSTECYSLGLIGCYYLDKGDYDTAIEYLEESVSIFKGDGHKDTLWAIKYLFLAYKKLGKKYNEDEIHTLIKEKDYIDWEDNYRLYCLFEDTSYLETADKQIQELADNLEPDVAAKFLSYPIPKAIVEEWEKVK
jgi:class 3 adenylate cyclase/TolB-like protein